ncbi:MAG: glycosyltransferase [Pirellulaceae bacterium]|nr:glycosyltransferase [Pirellulaceae bacterium]
MALLQYIHASSRDLAVDLEFDICLTGGEPGVFDAEAQALGAQLYHLPFSRRNLRGFTSAFRQLLKRGRYAAVHDHQDYAAGFHFGLAAGCLPPVRLVHVHNPILHMKNYITGPLRRASVSVGRRLVARYATGIVGTSNQLLHEYGYDRPPFARINRGATHCGFDVSRFHADRQSHHAEICREFGWDPSVKIVLFAGRLDSNADQKLNQKNPAFALEIARCCLESDERFRFLFAGGGDAARSDFEDKVRQWGRSAEIRFIGLRTDIPKLMVGADLFLFPSVGEGLGMVAVEAQAAGLPVLAADTVPEEAVVLPELVQFLSLSRSVSEWAGAAIRLACKPRLDASYCNRAVGASAFSIQNSAAGLTRLYMGAA